MTTVRIKTTDFKAAWLKALANLIGATIISEEKSTMSLRQVIDEGEADIAAGRGKTYTIEEIEALMNEQA